MRLKIVTRYLGIALLINAIFMFISAGVSAIYGLDSSFSPLLISGIITTIVAIFPLLFVQSAEEINTTEGLTIVVFAWIFSCLFGMLPFLIYGGEFNVVNAWFESVSGYTTTGSTILQNVEALPNGLLFWRSTTHWLGGMGVVLFMLLFLPSIQSFRSKLSKLEISSLSKNNFRFRAKQTIRIISLVYIVLTLSETILLTIAGMSLFDAVNHSFATIATGGFSTKNISIAYYDSFYIELIIIIFMLLSGMHFGLLYLLMTGKSFDILKSPVIRYFVLSLLTIGILVSLNIKFNSPEVEWGRALRNGFFQVVTLGTSTGFASADSSIWPPFAILLIVFATTQGGCSGSTSGGLKTDRVFIFFKSVRSQFLRLVHPSAIIPVKVGNQSIDKDIVYSVNQFIVFYLLILFIGALILTFLGVPLIESLTSSAACLGNAGPGFGFVGSLGNYSSIPALGKLVLSFEMLLGRMELYTLLLIFVIYRWK